LQRRGFDGLFHLVMHQIRQQPCESLNTSKPTEIARLHVAIWCDR
jgi:hypothetical protein